MDGCTLEVQFNTALLTFSLVKHITKAFTYLVNLYYMYSNLYLTKLKLNLLTFNQLTFYKLSFN